MKKRLLLCCICLFCCFLASAQTDTVAPQRVRVGLELGGNYTFLVSFGDFTQSQSQVSRSKNIAYQVGLFTDIPLRNKLTLRTGLWYACSRNLGYSVYNGILAAGNDTLVGVIEETPYLKAHYLKVPVIINYNFSENKNHFYLGVGIFAECALTGMLDDNMNVRVNDTSNFKIGGIFDPFLTERRQMHIREVGDDYSYPFDYVRDNFYNRFNLGFSLRLGYQISNFYIGVQGEFGILNMLNTKLYGNNNGMHKANLQLNIGYNIN